MRRRFLYVLAVLFVLTATYPIATIIVLWGKSWPWVQNNLASNLYGVLIFSPIAAAFFVTSVPPHNWITGKSARVYTTVVYGVLALILVFTVVLAVRDGMRLRPVYPPELAKSLRDNALASDRTARTCLSPPRYQYQSPTAETPATGDVNGATGDVNGASGAVDCSGYETPELARAKYLHKYTMFEEATPYSERASILWRNSSWVMWVGLFQTTVHGLVALFFAWYCVVLLWLRPSVPPYTWTGIVLFAVAASLFFPFRLYTDWYFNYYSFEFIRYSPGFSSLLILFLIIVIVLLLYRYPGRNVAIGVAVGVIANVLGILGAIWKPEAVVGCFAFISSIDRLFFAAIAFFIFLVVLALVWENLK